MRWPFTQRDSRDITIWNFEPLIVVHATDGLVYAQKTQAVFRPNGQGERSGHLLCMTPEAGGWFPEIQFTQVLETLQTFDIRVQRRTGRILVGVDATGESFTWYTNGEADRYLLDSQLNADVAPAPTHPTWTDEEIQKILATPVRDAVTKIQLFKSLHVEQFDGLCTFHGRTRALVVAIEKPPVLAYASAFSRGDDGKFPQLFVTERSETSENESPGYTWSGIDSGGIPTAWRIDATSQSNSD